MGTRTRLIALAAGCLLCASVALSTGCVNLTVQMPKEILPAVRAASPSSTATTPTAGDVEKKHRDALALAARTKAAQLSKRWDKSIRAAKVTTVIAGQNLTYGAAQVHIPGMPMELFVYRDSGQGWRLLGYQALARCRRGHPAFGVPSPAWEALLQ